MIVYVRSVSSSSCWTICVGVSRASRASCQSCACATSSWASASFLKTSPHHLQWSEPICSVGKVPTNRILLSLCVHSYTETLWDLILASFIGWFYLIDRTVKNTRPSVILEITRTGDKANYRLGVSRSCDYNYARDNYYQGHIKKRGNATAKFNYGRMNVHECAIFSTSCKFIYSSAHIWILLATCTRQLVACPLFSVILHAAKNVHHDDYNVWTKAIAIIASSYMWLALTPPPRHQHPRCY